MQTVKKWLWQSFEPQRRRTRVRLANDLAEFLRERLAEVGFDGAVLYREPKVGGLSGSHPALAMASGLPKTPWALEELVDLVY